MHLNLKDQYHVLMGHSVYPVYSQMSTMGKSRGRLDGRSCVHQVIFANLVWVYAE